MRSDADQFKKIVFELDVATAFVKTSHKVKFVQVESENEKKTPDLLVDDKIEVECKKKERLTKRDTQNQELFYR